MIEEFGEFLGPRTLKAGEYTIHARRFVISTGSTPSLPPIAGLHDVPYLTNETIFDLTTLPEHLIIIGGGPIGLEMAQAHHDLGAKVTVIALDFMENDDPELVEVLLTRLRDQGVALEGNAKIQTISHRDNQFSVMLSDKEITGSHLLVAAGRKPNISPLNLDAARVAHTPAGIKVGRDLRTSNKAIYAIGDVVGGAGFTHKAGYDAGIIIRRTIFGLFWAKASYTAMPHATYTSPALASVGLNEKRAKEKYGKDITVLKWEYAENDRARATRKTDGMVKVITTKKGKILGASIVGEQADELLAVWTLALTQGLKIGAMAGVVSPYPTLGEINKRAASSFYTPSLFSEKTKKIAKLLSFLG